MCEFSLFDFVIVRLANIENYDYRQKCIIGSIMPHECRNFLNTAIVRPIMHFCVCTTVLFGSCQI